MAVNPMDVLSVYKKTGGLMEQAGAASAPAAAGGGERFASALKTFIGDSVDTMHSGEKAADAAATGKANLASVATAIDNAEIVLDEIIAIRDKAIAAYQTITSSAI
ncbi:MAG: flagellar hook-basal body complex protein FliE [Alphaproteobacteria bacterium]|nr:flagellar hook-basal body complex protein FliE [Alphaproteobacteria bacterium]